MQRSTLQKVKTHSTADLIFCFIAKFKVRITTITHRGQILVYAGLLKKNKSAFVFSNLLLITEKEVSGLQ